MTVPSPLSAIFEKALRHNYPLDVVFELTHRCNLSCRHCYATGRGDELSTEETKQVLSELAENGCLFLTFTGGEVLCRPDFFEVAAYAVKKKMAIKVFTNGTMVDKETAARLAELRPVDVSVSLHAAQAADHDDFTLSEGAFARTIDAVRFLREEDIKVNIKLVMTNRNYKQYKDIKKLVNDLGASLSFGMDISPTRDGGHRPLEYRLDKEALQEVLGDDYLYDEAVRVPMQELESPDVTDLSTAAVCDAARNQCAVTPDGKVLPCVMLPVVLGDLTESSFKEIWRGEETSRFRDLRLSHLKECATCAKLRFCRRCSAVAMLEDGDMLGPSSWACMVTSVNKDIEKLFQEGGGVCG